MKNFCALITSIYGEKIASNTRATERRQWRALYGIQKEEIVREQGKNSTRITMSLHNSAKRRYQRLGKPEAKDKLGAGHDKLRGQPLEETGPAFVLEHVADDAHAGLGIFKVPALDPGLDHIEGCRNEQGGAGTRNGCYEILRPCGRVVVL